MSYMGKGLSVYLNVFCYFGFVFDLRELTVRHGKYKIIPLCSIIHYTIIAHYYMTRSLLGSTCLLPQFIL